MKIRYIPRVIHPLRKENCLSFAFKESYDLYSVKRMYQKSSESAVRKQRERSTDDHRKITRKKSS